MKVSQTMELVEIQFGPENSKAAARPVAQHQATAPPPTAPAPVAQHQATAKHPTAPAPAPKPQAAPANKPRPTAAAPNWANVKQLATASCLWFGRGYRWPTGAREVVAKFASRSTAFTWQWAGKYDCPYINSRDLTPGLENAAVAALVDAMLDAGVLAPKL